MAGSDYPMDTKFMTVSCSVLSTFSKIYGNEASLIQKDGESREEFLARVKKSRQSYAKPLMKNIDTIMCELAKKETQTIPAGVFESADKNKQIPELPSGRCTQAPNLS